MKKIQLHIHEVKQYIKKHEELAGSTGKDLLHLLTLLEDTVKESNPEVSDRMLNKKQYIDAIMGTHFEGRSGNIKIGKIREQLENAYDNGSLQGVGQERQREYNVAVIIRGGTFDTIQADRPNITVHKFDVDEQGSDPVIYQQETAEWVSRFNEKEILNALESKFE